MTKKEMMEMLKDPDVLKVLKEQKGDDKLEKLMADIEVGDNDNMEDIAKKYNAKLKELVTYFQGEVSSAKEEAVKEASKGAQAKEEQAINEFASKHPGMKNPDVISLMQPLYDKGKTLEEAYMSACRGLDINPESGEAGFVAPGDDKGKGGEGAKGGGKPKPKTSMKTSFQDDTDEGEEDDKGKKPLSLNQVLDATENEFIAKHGDPFDR